MRQESPGIEIDGVSTGWLHDRHPFLGNVIPKKGGGSYAIFQILLFERFVQPHGDGLQVAPSKAAVRGETLREDEEVFLLLGQKVIVRAEETADIGHAV